MLAQTRAAQADSAATVAQEASTSANVNFMRLEEDLKDLRESTNAAIAEARKTQMLAKRTAALVAIELWRLEEALLLAECRTNRAVQEAQARDLQSEAKTTTDRETLKSAEAQLEAACDT